MTRLWRLFRLWRSLAKDPRTPMAAKVFPWVALAYLVFPIDLVPDVIPILGQLDDVGVIVLLVTIALKVIPKDLWAEHGKKTDAIDV